MRVTRWRYTDNGYCKCTYEVNDAPMMPDRLDWRYAEPRAYIAEPVRRKEPVQLVLEFEW